MKTNRTSLWWTPLLIALGSGCSPAPCPAAAPSDASISPRDSSVEQTAEDQQSVETEVRASSPSLRRYVVQNSEIVELSSKETGRDYDLLIGLPASFESEPDKRYPTLYLLDGQWDFTLLNTLLGGLVYDEVVPEFLIVGITYAGANPDYGALRAEDYLPTSAQPPYAKKAFGGDAPKFLSFLESSVIPLVEKNYRADPDHRILSGASFGGLFTLYALFERPELFQVYLSLSPSVPWDDRWIFEREKTFHQEHPTLDRRLWLSVADAEPPDYLEANRAFFRQVEDHRYRDLNLKVRLIDGERHAGNKPEAYNRAIRFAFEGWTKAPPAK